MHAERPALDRIRVQEHDLDVEHDEQHRHDGVGHREPFGWLRVRHDAALGTGPPWPTTGGAGRASATRRSSARRTRLARTSRARGNRYWPSRPPTPDLGRQRELVGCGVGDLLVAAVHQPAEVSKTSRRPDRDERGRSGALLIADHVHVLVLRWCRSPRAVGARPGSSGRCASRVTLDDGVAWLVQEGDGVELSSIFGGTLAADSRRR